MDALANKQPVGTVGREKAVALGLAVAVGGNGEGVNVAVWTGLSCCVGEETERLSDAPTNVDEHETSTKQENKQTNAKVIFILIFMFFPKYTTT